MATASTLGNETRTFLFELEGWSRASLVNRPSPASWSALQVLEHLVKTEEGILVLARQGAQTPHRIGRLHLHHAGLPDGSKGEDAQHRSAGLARSGARAR